MVRTSKRARVYPPKDAPVEAASTSKMLDDNDTATAPFNGGDVKDKDSTIERLREEVLFLKEGQMAYYCSSDAMVPELVDTAIPERGAPAIHVKERILEQHELDNKPRLNTSSYVNVVHEPEEEELALLGLCTNLADGSVYPASIRLHDTVVNMIAQLWNCPKPKEENTNYSGAGTVGSTEACLLGGLALKFRWRKWYGEKHKLAHHEVVGVVPNVIMSSCFQACWEKLFRYLDIEPRFIRPKLSNHMKIDPDEIPALCDDKTMAVVGILGNHYNGAYDPIWDIDKVVSKVNKEKGFQIGIHVDGASGGFVAPFQDNMPPYDFRLPNVLCMSGSGHKFGESCCGTGWLIFREREDLAEHVAIRVTYLGGVSDSLTLNFSRPATGVYIQYYKFLRLGKEGYRQKVKQQMEVAKYIRDELKGMVFHGQAKRFVIVDDGDEYSLPVVGARLNPALTLGHNDIDMQHAMSEYHWYVSGYNLTFGDFSKTGSPTTPLCSDIDENTTMFRIVVKSNLTYYLAQDLINRFKEIMPMLDKNKGQYKSLRMLVGKWANQNKTKEKAHHPC